MGDASENLFFPIVTEASDHENVANATEGDFSVSFE